MGSGVDEAIAQARAQAARSVETFRHGAALLAGGKVVASGRNRNINACGLWSIHAEMDAVWKAKIPGTHVVVVRLRRDRDFGYSRPCAGCMRTLRKAGIRRVTYTTGDRDTLSTETI